jgi:2-polyprenyl-3-methyl-5-hydroxy-6-metoxy-1,4-benzoquinol methylase
VRLPDRRSLSDPDHVFLYEHDRRELHNPNPRDFMGLMYRHRLATVIRTIVRRARGVRVLDVGCAQGNFTLALAERGYHVVAVDLRHSFLQYLRMKHERGSARCINASLDGLPFRRASFDVVLLGEVIEHVANPERLLDDAASLLREGGILVLTTPNGDRLHTGLPNLSAIRDRAALERRQFEPDADGHLFLLTRDELLDAVRTTGLRMVSHEFFSSPWVTGRLRFRHVATALPLGARHALDYCLTRVEFLSRRLCDAQLLVAERQSVRR